MFDIDSEKLSKAMEIIDEIAENFNDADENKKRVSELEKLTGKSDIDINMFFEYWGWTSLEELAKRLLIPDNPEKLTDTQIYEVVKKICEVEYSESEIDYWLDVLEKETGLDVIDYIYYPDSYGLDTDAEYNEIAQKIIADRKK
ncbi:MAG: hypothetical protein K2G63_02200 [Oscillospiraceae bacterium]|nr:hypothetical protein [Oscillospiraceae bacterium]